MLALRSIMFAFIRYGILFLGCLAMSPTLGAEESIPIELQGVGIEEHLGNTIDLNLTFQDEAGSTVPLKNFFEGSKPVILTLVYYQCPNLCNLLLNGFLEGLKNMPWTVGEKFRVVTISIDTREKPELAKVKKQAYLAQYGRSGVESSWSFLTGEEKNIQTLAQQVGFSFRWDDEQKQFAHMAAIFVLTPSGKISRYLYGISYDPMNLKLALLEASEGKIGNIVDKVLLFCYHYDPQGRKYALFATKLMKLAGAVTVIAIVVLVALLSRRKGALTQN